MRSTFTRNPFQFPYCNHEYEYLYCAGEVVTARMHGSQCGPVPAVRKPWGQGQLQLLWGPASLGCGPGLWSLDSGGWTATCTYGLGPILGSRGVWSRTGTWSRSRTRGLSTRVPRYIHVNVMHMYAYEYSHYICTISTRPGYLKHQTTGLGSTRTHTPA